MKWIFTPIPLLLLVTVTAWVVWGRQGAVAAATLGTLAAVIQYAAGRLAKGSASARSPFPAGWLAGTALRLLGVLVFAGLVVLDRETFAPLPAALGYIGVLIPLLMLELRKTQ